MQIIKIALRFDLRVTYVKQKNIQFANIEFNSEGTPVSRDFDDIYFSTENGLEESRYVFLEGNRLRSRFINHPRPLFIVAESGFGTGLNFLALWQMFATFRRENPNTNLQRLHFISFEKFPLTLADLRKAHQHWPELAPWAEQLQAQWPQPFAGCHRLLLDEGRVTLDLWLGDINTLISQLDDTSNQQVDAWFLDGFSPAKNPQMWTASLFHAVARLTRPGGTVATFTAAGFVRRGLGSAGFTLHKNVGFGRKREMLIGQMDKTLTTPPVTPWFARTASQQRDVAIIGGGIASALLALTLLRRGWQVTLYCADDMAAEGASKNRQGAFYPLLNPHEPALSHFFPAAFTFARRLYDALAVPFDHQWCGVTQLAWDEKNAQKIAQMLAMGLPQSIATATRAAEMLQTTGVTTGCDGITYPAGGWLCPQQLTRELMALATTRGLASHYRYRIETLSQHDNGWLLNQQQWHEVVLLANGHHLTDFPQTARLPVSPVAGQVSHIPVTPALSALHQVLCYDGYLTPHHPGNQQHCIGASYHREQAEATFSTADQQHNRQRLINCLPQETWPYEVDVSANEARCGVRCATRDHLPLVGNVPDYDATLQQYAALATSPQAVATAPVYHNLYMLGALGSRGLCSAPLAAEILAAQMSGEPLPLDRETLAALSPNRRWVKKLLKGKEVKQRISRHY